MLAPLYILLSWRDCSHEDTVSTSTFISCKILTRTVRKCDKKYRKKKDNKIKNLNTGCAVLTNKR